MSTSICSAEGLIAHLRLMGDYWQLWVMNDKGKHARQLTFSPVDKVNISWGPTNDQLIYNTNNGETWVYNLKTNKQKQILKDIQIIDASWSPDGESVAYGINPVDGIHGFTTLWLSDLNGENRRQIAGNLSGDVSGAQWFNDGKKMVFLNCKLSSDFRVHHDFWQSTRDHGKAKEIVGDDQQFKFEQSISHNGGMVYSSAETGHYEIWKMSRAGSKPVQLTYFSTSAGNPAWSTDDSQIVFDAEQHTMGVFLMSSSGMNIKRLTPVNVLAMRPEWSKQSDTKNSAERAQ